MKKVIWLFVLILLIAGLYYLNPNKNAPGKNSSGQPSTGALTPTEVAQESNSNFPLEIISPKDKTTVSTAMIKVAGKTAPGADVFVNEKEIKADGSGNFSTDYELLEGENNLYITVNDNLGNYAEKTIVVNLQSAQ